MFTKFITKAQGIALSVGKLLLFLSIRWEMNKLHTVPPRWMELTYFRVLPATLLLLAGCHELKYGIFPEELHISALCCVICLF